MRFFLTADLQLRNFTEFSGLTPEGYNSRLVRLLDELTRLLEENGPFDEVILAGDIWNNKATLETDLLDLTHQYFGRWRAMVRNEEIISLLGNHDTAFLSANIHSLRQFEAYGPVITKATVYKGIAFSPWRASTQEIEADLEALSGKARVLVGHWTVKGAAFNRQYRSEGGIDPGLEALGSFDLVLLGDVHKSQQLGSNILYLGSPAQNDFGEEGDEKMVWILETEVPAVTPVPTLLPEYKTVDTLVEAETARSEGYYVRLRAKTREDLKEGTALGLRVEQDFTESVAAADSVRALVTTLEDAVKAYAVANGREDLLERGLSFLSEALDKRTLPPAKLTFKSVRAENFLSYQYLDWDLSAQNGFVIVHGEVLSDAAYDSNGAGKTALYEALFYALYGVTLRYGSRKDLTIREGEKGNRVSVRFELAHPGKETNEIVITRTRPGGIKLLIEHVDATCNDANLTQHFINQLIGTQEFFLRLTLLALNYHPSFLRLTDAEKKRFIDEFSGLDAFSEARETVLSQLANLEVEEQRVEFEKTRLAERQILLGQRVEEIAGELAEFTELERQAEAERKSQIAVARKELAALKAPEKPQLPDTKKLENEISEHESTVTAARQALETQRQNQYDSLKPLHQKTFELQNEIKSLQEGLVSDRCPTCLRPFAKAKETNRILNERIVILSKEHTEAEAEVDGLESGYKEDNAEFASEIRTLETHVREMQVDLSQRKDSRQTLLRRYEVAQSLYDSNRQRLTERIESIRSIKSADPGPLKVRLAEAQADAEKAVEELGQVEKKLADFLTDKAALEFWLTGFGNRGCKSLLYTALIDRLNTELARICNILSGGALRLRLLPYSESAKGEAIERISLEVSNYLGASSFEGDSLGERNRIDIAVGLALRRVLMAFSGYSASLLFVDEPWVGLDNSGKANVYTLLEAEARNCLLFATDQDKSTKGFAEGKILTVRKENRISTLSL